jgi:hypothetical protein
VISTPRQQPAAQSLPSAGGVAPLPSPGSGRSAPSPLPAPRQ